MSGKAGKLIAALLVFFVIIIFGIVGLFVGLFVGIRVVPSIIFDNSHEKGNRLKD